MQPSDTGRPGGREVSFATKGDARLIKALALLVAASALVIAAVPLFTPLPWLVLLTAAVGILLLVLAGAMWMSESDNAAKTARLQAQGVVGSAEIRDIEAVENESISYRIGLRIRVAGMDSLDVTHLCSHWRCVDAVKTFQDGRQAGMQAIASSATGEWMIVH